MMEVGIGSVHDVPQASPDQVGMYGIPVTIQAGMHHHQTSIHQSLI